jgi:hypothetical protein
MAGIATLEAVPTPDSGAYSDLEVETPSADPEHSVVPAAMTIAVTPGAEVMANIGILWHTPAQTFTLRTSIAAQ